MRKDEIQRNDPLGLSLVAASPATNMSYKTSNFTTIDNSEHENTIASKKPDRTPAH